MSTTEIKITGFGGQGVILTGMLIGKAAAIYGGKNAVLAQSFGPEARGGSCAAQVIVSDEPIYYPYVRTPEVLITLSQEAYTKFIPEIAPNGILIYEKDLVNPENMPTGVKPFPIPSTAIAEELGKKIVLNIVTVGFFTAVTGIVKPEAVKKAIADSVPKGTIDLNLRAFDEGYAYFSKNK
jgi:2-oxoglutarate ferredoxin oxidoreductase subunit gamma